MFCDEFPRFLEHSEQAASVWKWAFLASKKYLQTEQELFAPYLSNTHFYLNIDQAEKSLVEGKNKINFLKTG